VNLVDLEKLLKNHIIVDIQAKTKEEALRELVYRLARIEKLKDPELLLQNLLERESLSSTGLGFGIAFPHIRSHLVEKPIILAARSKYEIEYDSIDGYPVRLFFLFIIPQDNPKVGIQILSMLTRLLKKEDVRQKLLRAKNEKEFIASLKFSDSTLPK